MDNIIKIRKNIVEMLIICEINIKRENKISKMTNLFIVILRYIVPLSEIDTHRQKHLEFLDEYYSKGNLISSGRQNPPNGGVIIAKATSRKELEAILAQDPFYIERLAEYQIFEFIPTKYIAEFKKILEL